MRFLVIFFYRIFIRVWTDQFCDSGTGSQSFVTFFDGFDKTEKFFDDFIFSVHYFRYSLV